MWKPSDGGATVQSMALVTRVLPAGPHGGRVVVELDGERWTSMPRRWAVRRSIAPGRELDDHEQTRIEEQLSERVGRFLCVVALDRGGRSRAELERRLARYGLPARVVERTIAAVSEAGLADDDALASSLVRSLRRRGYGDARVRRTLARRGLDGAAAELPPESREDAVDRAVGALGRRHGGDPARAVAFLARRGFGLDVCRAAVASRATGDA